jgi:phage shock protein A
LELVAAKADNPIEERRTEMNLAQRFTLLVKGNLTSLMDKVENPETSLDQLLLEMGRQMEAAKRATAQAMANEKRLRVQVAAEREAAGRWQAAARRALAREDEAGAREALRQAEVAARQAAELARQLAEQEHDTARVRESVTRLRNRMRRAAARLQLLRARLRQTEARRACGRVLAGVESADLYGEFERLGERVELAAAGEAAYLEIDDELSGEGLRHRLAEAELDEAVEDGLARLRAELADAPEAAADGDAPASATAPDPAPATAEAVTGEA